MAYTEFIKLLEIAEGRTDTAGMTEKILSERDVFAETRSIGLKEFYQAAASGLKPEIAFRLADYLDYQGERFVVWRGKRYRVLRTFTPAEANYVDIVVDNIINQGGVSYSSSAFGD